MNRAGKRGTEEVLGRKPRGVLRIKKNTGTSLQKDWLALVANNPVLNQLISQDSTDSE